MQSSHNFWLVAISFVVAALASSSAPELMDRLLLLASMPLHRAWRLAGALAHPFEMATVASPIETKSQADTPRPTMRDASNIRNTSNAMQGGLPGKPVNADDFGEMLKGNTMAA